MRFSLRFRSEDVLIYSIVFFSLMYPLFIAFIIWYEESRKEWEYMNLLFPLAKLVAGVDDCRSVYSKDINFMLDENLEPKELAILCQSNRGSKITNQEISIDYREGIEVITYTLVLDNRKRLVISAISDGTNLKVSSVK